VTLARELGVRQISFLAVDVSNAHAFAREGEVGGGLALAADELPKLQALLSSLQHDHGDEFKSKFIAESPEKLARILQYFSALCGQAEFPIVKCNAPDFSAVITAELRMQPCFFIPGPESLAAGRDMGETLNDSSMLALRGSINAGERWECKRCVCSMWREPDSRGSDSLLKPRQALN
jgi:Fe-coproporphyrin III synthase